MVPKQKGKVEIKRIEQEFRKLKDEYDNLASRFKSLKKEKEFLQLELERLSDLVITSHDGGRKNKDDQNENNIIRGEKYEDKEHQLLRMDDDHEEMPLASLEKWYSIMDHSGILDQPCSNSQWLDFWT
uniref:Leucine zipper homeobox-associated domain-containing protein n=1 Tax=Cajanus cajan TaxID=3821 RepID=A0A151RS79_CAJCA|nr:hypothetical protein KK1_033091 [Cajanus cajan]